MLDNVITMAGIPNIMQVMLDAVTPRLRKGRMMHSHSVDLNQPEGAIADMLKEHQALYQDVSMGSYPTIRDGRPCTQLVLRSIDAPRLNEAHQELLNKLRSQSLMP